MLAQVPKGSAEMVAAAIRTVFAQPSPVHVRNQLEAIAAMLGPAVPQSGRLLWLAGAVLVEAHDEWQVSERRYLSEGWMALLDAKTADPKEVATPVLLTA